jgi:hypothetical protein
VPRKMIVRQDGSEQLLTETIAEDEAQLQALVEANPDLLPIEEFGMTGPLLVVGRETALPSGGIDLVALAKGGEILIVEFKTGPQNSDFRSALAQLLDYGSDLWQMTFEEFESTVPSRYFASARCVDSRVAGLRSLLEAAKAVWGPEQSEEEVASMRDSIARQLDTGQFHYVLAAQRFTPTMERSIEYLNATNAGPRFYAVEIVRFHRDGLNAFESRTIVKPLQRASSSPASLTNEAHFLEGIADETYRDALRDLFEACRGLGFKFEWGTLGTSIRVPTPDRTEPLSIAWIFPPGRPGWMNLTDLTFGYHPPSAASCPGATSAIEEYVRALAELPGATETRLGGVRGYRVGPAEFIQLRPRVVELLASLTERVNRG